MDTSARRRFSISARAFASSCGGCEEEVADSKIFNSQTIPAKKSVMQRQTPIPNAPLPLLFGLNVYVS